MNYRRGFGRIYATLTVLWLVLAALVAINEPTLRGDQLLVTVIAIAVPVIGYVFFFVVVPWIARGFRSPQK
jgi:hypothetical protein